MLYLVRRHLGYGPSEWRQLPWWEQLLLLEGLQEEFYEPAEEEDDISENPDALRALGAQVRVREVA